MKKYKNACLFLEKGTHKKLKASAFSYDLNLRDYIDKLLRMGLREEERLEFDEWINVDYSGIKNLINIK